MTLPEQLRAIAERGAILLELEQLGYNAVMASADSTAVREAAEQPGEEPVPISAPSPAAPIEQAGSPVAKAPAAARTADSAPPGTHSCPECGKTTATEVGLTIHRRQLHGVKPDRSAKTRLADRKKPPANGDSRPFSFPIGKAANPPEPVIRHGKEAWLCTRCPQTFESRERLNAHMQKGHQPELGTRPFGEQPVMERSGGGSVIESVTA